MRRMDESCSAFVCVEFWLRLSKQRKIIQLHIFWARRRKMLFACSLLRMSSIVTKLRLSISRAPACVWSSLRTVLNTECPSQNISTDITRGLSLSLTSVSPSAKGFVNTLGKPVHLVSQILSTIWPPLSKLFTTETHRHARHNRIFYHFYLVFPCICSKAYGHNYCFCFCSFTVDSERIRTLENNKKTRVTALKVSFTL